jgi:prolipoprotein diacylglyceryltransferase
VALVIGHVPAIRRPRRPGDALVAFAIGYGLCRLGIEMFRADTMAAGGVLSSAQGFSVALAGAGLAAWLARRGRRRDPE